MGANERAESADSVLLPRRVSRSGGEDGCLRRLNLADAPPWALQQAGLLQA